MGGGEVGRRLGGATWQPAPCRRRTQRSESRSKSQSESESVAYVQMRLSSDMHRRMSYPSYNPSEGSAC